MSKILSQRYPYRLNILTSLTSTFSFYVEAVDIDTEARLVWPWLALVIVLMFKCSYICTETSVYVPDYMYT